jgi:hypothetical protein
LLGGSKRRIVVVAIQRGALSIPSREDAQPPNEFGSLTSCLFSSHVERSVVS